MDFSGLLERLRTAFHQATHELYDNTRGQAVDQIASHFKEEVSRDLKTFLCERKEEDLILYGKVDEEHWFATAKTAFREWMAGRCDCDSKDIPMTNVSGFTREEARQKLMDTVVDVMCTVKAERILKEVESRFDMAAEPEGLALA